MCKKISLTLLLMNVVALSLGVVQPVNADPHWKNQYWKNRGQCNAPAYHYINNGTGYRYMYGNRPVVANNARIDTIQNNVNTMITRGLSNGRLTQREADRLVGMQQKIDNMQARYNTNGSLNRQEQARLSNEISKLQLQLRRELSDRNSYY